MHFARNYPSEGLDSYLEVPFGQFQILGRSIAGVETVLSIPQFNLSFDTGKAPSFAYTLNYVALSHWHLDHAGGLAHFLSQRCLNDLSPLNIVIPPQKMKETEEYLSLLKKISGSRLDYVLKSAEEPIAIRKDLILRGVPSFHCTPSVAYLVEEKRRKLLPEFEGKSQAEIVQAKRQNREVSKEIIEPLVAFSGDTLCEFLKTPAVRARCLMLECTFFDEDMDYGVIRHYGHTHIHDWKEHAGQIESRHVLMIHTSQRYSKKEIENACVKNLPKDLLDRLIVFR